MPLYIYLSTYLFKNHRLSEKMEGFDYRFHRHIRKHHIKGFPDITIPERILRTPTHDSSGQKLMENEDFRF